jgi:uncharacterized membrane protein YkoI
MSFVTKTISKVYLVGALALTTALAGSVVQAQSLSPESAAAVQAVSLNKSQAVAIALHAVGGGTVILALLERRDGPVHWSIDIVGSTHEYEVWVSTSGKVLKIITQPL